MESLTLSINAFTRTRLIELNKFRTSFSGIIHYYSNTFSPFDSHSKINHII